MQCKKRTSVRPCQGHWKPTHHRQGTLSHRTADSDAAGETNPEGAGTLWKDDCTIINVLTHASNVKSSRQPGDGRGFARWQLVWWPHYEQKGPACYHDSAPLVRVGSLGAFTFIKGKLTWLWRAWPEGSQGRQHAPTSGSEGQWMPQAVPGHDGVMRIVGGPRLCSLVMAS